MWTVIYIARNLAAGQRVRQVLEREGLLVRMRPVGEPRNAEAVELLVPEAEAEEAHEVLAETLGR
ncbi:MAG: glutamate decarboxylase [Firmicutes bacterium]|nr:glutamate decarboxylase [Bacillota bacterium]